MKKLKFDMKIVEVAIDRLARERKQKTGLVPEWYLFGYAEAIYDLLWDYTGLPLSQLQMDAYDARVMMIRKSIENSPIKKIKFRR